VGLHFALLFDGARLERWHLHCLDELEQVAVLAWVVASPGPAAARMRSPLLERYAKRVERSTVVQIGDRFARLIPPEHDDGFAESVDFVLGLGNVVVPRGLAEAARLGVWRFEHELVPARLPFFHEVCAENDVTRAALLRIDPDGGQPETIVEGVFRTDPRSYLGGRDRILDAIASWPARACKRLAETPVELPPATSTERDGHEVGFARFAAGVARRRLAVAWERLFRHPQWNVGVLDRGIETLLEPDAYTGEDVDWFPLHGRREFLADPFAVERDARLVVLCESFDYRSSRGRISTLEHAGGAFTDGQRDALVLPGHSSYPYLLDLPEGLHCVPETADAGEVALYRMGEDAGDWVKIAVLLPGVAGVDPTVFRHHARWWLMCTRKGPQEDTELWAWHAPAVTGPWTPHALNPIKTDVRGARPAGPPFVHEGVLLRPAQDCSRTYGGRVVVQRVDELTPTSFAEEQIAVIEASPRSRYPIGPHTLTPIGGRVLVDGRRTVFVPAAFRAFVRIWVRDVARRLRR
jgi:hypothetical protein